MKYIYGASDRILPSEKLKLVDDACHRLAKKLESIDLSDLNISEYTENYLGLQIKNLTPVLQTYAYLITLNLATATRPIEELTVCDYGSGPGLMLLLTKELGVRETVYVDIYETSVEDAKKLAQKISLNIDQFVCGDIDKLIESSKNEGYKIDSLFSFDVIEHIYDIEKYIRKLPYVSENSLTVTFGSGANQYNPRLKKRYTKLQIAVEKEDRIAKRGSKKRDSLKAYQQIRGEIIMDYAPQLPKEVVHSLAISTRGLIKEDIHSCIDEYIEHNSISYSPNHPTNTCDPMTGNWAERFMQTDWLESIFVDVSAEPSTHPGYWGTTNNKLVTFAGRILNLIIRVKRRKSLVFAPYYVIQAHFGKTGYAKKPSPL